MGWSAESADPIQTPENTYMYSKETRSKWIQKAREAAIGAWREAGQVVAGEALVRLELPLTVVGLLSTL